MITEDDIIRILSDPRFRRTVRAICRLAFTDKDPERGLAENWGMITDEEACAKHGITSDELWEAINNRWILSKNGLVDDDSVATWVKGRADFKAKVAAKAERAKNRTPRPPKPKPERGPAPDGTMWMQDAALALGLNISSAAPLASQGKLQRAGRGLVTTASVEHYKATRIPRKSRVPVHSSAPSVTSVDP